MSCFKQRYFWDDLLERDISIPRYLYHATYIPLLESIEKEGLGGISATVKWEYSKQGVVYLADDPHTAMMYAKSSEMIPEVWRDQVVVLRVNTEYLDETNFMIDGLISGNEGECLEYYGVIPRYALEVVTL